jgi:pimeloyl-ACP methyl ester carboxylesterase
MLGPDSVAVSLPGCGALRPAAFTGSKDAPVEWLNETLLQFDESIDLVGHDIGALLTMRLVSAFDVPVRSWVVDVPNIFHPRFEWPERMHQLQTAGVGEDLLETERSVPVDDPRSTTSRLLAAGVPEDLASEMGSRHDALMSQSILDFYRSAAPNVAADWWNDVTGPVKAAGLVLLLPDSPEDEAMSVEVAATLGARTGRLEGLNHCWMAEAPEVVAGVLNDFWTQLDQLHPSSPE